MQKNRVAASRLDDFLADCVDKRRGQLVSLGDLFAVYEQWSAAMHPFAFRLGYQGFNREIKKLLPSSAASGRRYFTGIALGKGFTNGK